MTLKESLLSMLLTGKSVSGEAAADTFGVTRAAVWKTVCHLRQEGYPIEALPGTGYRLCPSDRLYPGRLAPLLPPQIGHFEVFNVTDSTNRQAKIYAEEHPGIPALFIANEQTGGRGRRGRSFRSEKDCGLYMSLVLFPSLPAQTSVRLTTAAAVVVAQVLEEMSGTPTGIKWVNDIYMKGKKVCGILTEGALDVESGTFRYAVVGIGINVRHTDFPPELADIATTVEDAAGTAPDRTQLAAEITRRLLSTDPTSPAVMDAYRARMFLTGHRVNVLDPAGTYPATVTGVADDGSLLIRTEDGTERALSSGDVSVRGL